ncbi:MAG: toxic anion resistance protein [Oscillospiraceae bacterium]|nr:toxic anion resistance protein [Oscillospiraceae bacterium]
MAINLRHPKRDESTENPVIETQASSAQVLDIQPVQEYNVVLDKQQVIQSIDMQEIDQLTSQISVDDMDSIVSFGSEAAESISRASDSVLNNMSLNQINESGELLKALSRVMDQFNIDELKEPKGLQKLFNKAQAQVEKILKKYNTMGAEIDKIYVALRKYQEEIKQSNRKLSTLFESNVEFYHELEKYIYAGDQGCKEIQAAIEETQAEINATGNQELRFQLQSYQNALALLEQRVQDLRTAEVVAMESIPMLKTMEFSNYNLYRKMESAIIITLPVFKQALAQAILLKRQKIQAEAMSEWDAKTNELLMRNAQNTVDQAKVTARMASGSSIQIETLENAWKTITSGIDEVQQIESDAHKKREEDKIRLQAIKNDFNSKYHVPDKNKR